MTSSKTLRRRQRDVAEFDNALGQLLGVLEPVYHPFSGERAWIAPEGKEREAARRTAEVNRVAGRAAYALASVGSVVDWKPPGQPPGYSQPVNPAAAWSTILQESPMFDVSMIHACNQQAIGVLDAQASEAQEHEDSFTGRVENVTGFFARIRGDRERGQPSQYGAVAFGALVTGVVGLFVAYLTFTFGWVGS
jgi:hypothetical protein